MNFFVNSVLNIVLTLFNSSLSDSWNYILCLAIASENLLGMIYTFKVVRGKVKFPVLYIIPIIRELVVIFKLKMKDVFTRDILLFGFIFQIIGSLLAIDCFANNTYSEDISIIIILTLLLATILLGIGNANFFFKLNEETEDDCNILTVFCFYFFPSLTLSFMKDKIMDEKEKKMRNSKKAMKVLSKTLALIIFVNTIMSQTFSSYAADYSSHIVNDEIIKTGCPICDNTNEKILLPLYMNDITYEYANVGYAITCSDCEIFHVFIDNDLDIPRDDMCNPNMDYYYGFFDFNNTNLKTHNNYDEISFKYDPSNHYAILEDVVNENEIILDEEYYLNGVYDGYYNDNWDKEIVGPQEPIYTFFLTGRPLQSVVNSYYYEGDASFSIATDSAEKFYPKNKDYEYQKVSNITQENVLETNNTYKDKKVDNTNVKDYTSNNNTYENNYDNTFNFDNFLVKSANKSLIAVATTGALSLLTAITAPVWGTALTTAVCITGGVLTTLWLAERTYECVKLYTDDYSCKEEAEAAGYRYLEETTSDLVGLGVGSACSRLFGNVVSNFKDNKLLDYCGDSNTYQEVLDRANAIKDNNYKPTEDMISKSKYSRLKQQNKLTDSQVVGGNRYYNANGKLPSGDDLIYYETDISFDKTGRNSQRIVWSNKGDLYYSRDHYDTFVRIEGLK